MRLTCFLLLTSLLIGAGCNETTPPPPIEIRLTSENLGPPLVGFGAQMNPYLYCHPNWGDVTESNVKKLESEVIALHPQHVRIFIQLGWFSDHHSDEISKDDPRIRESFIRTVRLAQRAGATVNLTLWFGFWKTPEDSMRRFADILAMLVNDEHLDAIRYVTLGNEPNDHEDKIAMELYDRTYLLLHRELRRVGLRDRIQIISGDLVATNQERWFANLGQKLSKVSDGYSAHMYWDYWDTDKLLRRVSEVPRIVSALPSNEQRPLFITEFGVRGISGPHEEPGYLIGGTPISDTNVQATEIAWLMLEALNRGYVATVEWDCYDAWYDVFMHYGVIGDVKSNWKLRPAYHVLRLFTHTTQPGWRAVRIADLSSCSTGFQPVPNSSARVENPCYKSDSLVAAATRSGDGDDALYLLNRSDSRRVARIRSARDVFETVWCGDRLTHPRLLHPDKSGSVEIPIAPQTLIAVTTLRPDL